MPSDLPLAYLALAFALPIVISLVLGRKVIQQLRDLKYGQRVRDDGPQRHLQKEGTPTMGGVLIVSTFLLGAFLAGQLIHDLLPRRMLLVFGLTFAMGLIGFVDDYLKIQRGRSLGLKARQKLLWQFVVAIIFVVLLARDKNLFGAGAPESVLNTLSPVLWYGLWIFAIVGTANAINLADGLDGLASGLCTVAAAGFAVLGLLTGNLYVLVLGLALAGACLGFLWFNRHPARMFMGDVGSLALGGALVGMAAVLDTPVSLIGLCLVPFIEAASVIIQVISFKTTGKRVFKMSPLHHHFELSGWSEQRVVWTFWCVGLFVAFITVLLGVHWKL